MRDAYIIAWVWCNRLGNEASSPPLVCSKLPFPPCASGCAVISSRGRASHSGVRSSPQSSCPGTHLAPARPPQKTPAQISTQTRPGSHQSHLACLSTDLGRYQGPQRYPPLLAAGPGLRSAGRRIHRPRSAQRPAVLGLCQRRSAAASSIFAARIQQHLDRCGISLCDLVWQTDNGSEFIGGYDRRGHPTGFPTALGDSQHVRIPPAAHTFQSDVETVHRLVKMSSLPWNRSTVGAISSPKLLPTSFTSTWSVPTPTNKTSVLGRSSSNSNRAGLSNSVCFHPFSWIIT